jgi:HTH-type transcriptional repressor of puuD
MTSAPQSGPGEQPQGPSFIVRRSQVQAFDRGNGVATLPFVGKWSPTTTDETNKITTGMTVFQVGRGLPLHSHNVEESVLIVEGLATAVVGDERFDLEPGEATWVPAGVPHYFQNRGDSPMTIYWVYGGRRVTRTITETGETFEHLSESDRGGRPAD